MIERTLFIASLVLGGCASVVPVQKTSAPPPPVAKAPEDRHVYRVDFVVVANEPGKPAQSSAYTLNLEDYDNGELHLGSNVQLTPQSRQDLGLKIKASLRPMTNDDLLLHDAVELSAVEEAQTIHKITTSGDALLHGGQQTLVASLEDPLSHKRYQVSASATRLR
ncbi:MAG TPA: hypothetical protein VGH87_30745 [Polyangiaceae bacterium]